MKHVAHVLSEAGDILLTWDPKIREDRENMIQVFTDFLDKGYEAYAVGEEHGRLDAMFGEKYIKGARVLELDDMIGKLILRKKIVVAPAKVQGGYPESGMNQGRL